MGRMRPAATLRMLLLVVPLLAIASYLLVRGRATWSPPTAAPPSAPLLAGFPPPDADYPAERLHERVDGAADGLRAAGCRRLLLWRVTEPPAELELLRFGTIEGAASVLNRDVGPARTPGPGDEASVGDEAIFFRRGTTYARLLAEPGASPDPEALLGLAVRVDGGLRSAGGTGGAP